MVHGRAARRTRRRRKAGRGRMRLLLVILLRQLRQTLGGLEGVDLRLVGILAYHLSGSGGAVFKNGDVLQIIDMNAGSDEIDAGERRWRRRLSRSHALNTRFQSCILRRSDCVYNTDHILWLPSKQIHPSTGKPAATTFILYLPPYKSKKKSTIKQRVKEWLTSAGRIK